ncbi:putative sodium-coupled neutral amino acid transporter 10 isoform X2 [Dysidea avara]|uniref:putative sodium-coupled neutral amino acid transporter 10 isoform X2 n=1 Tax=Dysidea avara TaxID=196820 RepID=UPI00332198CC
MLCSPYIMWSRVVLWNITGVFKCIPIFALAFACHPQLLIIYDAHPDPTVSRMTSIISNSVHLIGSMYSLVAFGGYMTFFVDHVDGDVLSNFYPTLFSQLIKLGFALSVVVSFPLVIFPCRVSINSLVSQIQQMPLEAPVRIPQGKFMAITIFITFSTLFVAILLPHIETVLALNGATVGSLISYVYPAAIFLSVTHYREEMRTTAKVLLGIGLIILMASTVSILISNMDDAEVDHNRPIKYPWPQPKMVDNFPAIHKEIDVPKEIENPVDVLQNVDGAEDKGGGADDSRVEQYPDQPMMDESKKASPSSPTSEQASDATQETKSENDNDHKELISKLETLEERVQKLESENEELKEQKLESDSIEKEETEDQEFKKVDTDSHVMENHEGKVVDKAVVAVETDETKTLLQDDAAKLKNPESLPKTLSKDTPAGLQLDKDNRDIPAVVGAHQPVNSPNVPLKPQVVQGHQQRPLVHGTTRELEKDDKINSLQNNPAQQHHLNIDTEKDQARVETHGEKVKTKANTDFPDLTLDREQSKTKVVIPDVSLHKEIIHEDVHDAEKVPQPVKDIDLDRHERNVDLRKTNDDSLEHLVDQKLEQELLKLKAAEDVGVRSRDLLHSDEQLNSNDLKLDNNNKDDDNNDQKINPKLDDSSKTEFHVDEMGGTPSPAAPIAVNKTVVSETTSSIKRSMLSLKQSDNNETHSLNNGG